jgi:hypothetical protein
MATSNGASRPLKKNMIPNPASKITNSAIASGSLNRRRYHCINISSIKPFPEARSGKKTEGIVSKCHLKDFAFISKATNIHAGVNIIFSIASTPAKLA